MVVAGGASAGSALAVGGMAARAEVLRLGLSAWAWRGMEGKRVAAGGGWHEAAWAGGGLQAASAARLGVQEACHALCQGAACLLVAWWAGPGSVRLGGGEKRQRGRWTGKQEGSRRGGHRGRGARGTSSAARQQRRSAPGLA